MTAREHVRLLIPIWGARYIDEFARIAMPFHMADGNIPYLAAETDLEIVILTTEDSQHILDQDASIKKLKELAPVRFIYIDDLLSNENYGVILTLAYARGIADSGPDQTDTCFVFMNADFILADGAMRELVSQLRAGHRCIMAPSLRACTENVLQPLEHAVGADGVARMTAREMVALALGSPHPTVVGKTVNQDLIYSIHYNQIYWKVDPTTLLARYHLIFMLAIKPEVPIGFVNSYCDYGFVPELVPSRNISVLSDSDAFFMLELQPIAREQNLVRAGSAHLGRIADELSTWTTAEHRLCAKVDIVFRSGELPATLPAARRQLAAFMADVGRRMSREPVSHVDHPYWMGGVRSWVALKSFDPDRNTPLPPELGRPAFLMDRSRSSGRAGLRRLQQAYLPWLTRHPVSASGRAVVAAPPTENFDLDVKRMWAALRLGETGEARSLADGLKRRDPSHPDPHAVQAITTTASRPHVAISPLLSFQVEARKPPTVKEMACLWGGRPLSARLGSDGDVVYNRPGRWVGNPSWVSAVEFTDESGRILNDVSARIVVDLAGVTDPATGDIALSPDNLHVVECNESGHPTHRWTGSGAISAIHLPMWTASPGLCSLTIVSTGTNEMADIVVDINGEISRLGSDHPGWLDGSTIELPVPVRHEGCCEVRLRAPKTISVGSDIRKLGVAWARARLIFPLPPHPDMPARR